MMGALISLIAVAVFSAIAWLAVAVADLRFLFGVAIPGVAFAVFLGGIVVRVLMWAKTPVPYRIPTTAGQQKSLKWIENDELDNPSGFLGVVGRMLLEVLFFRSLFRNSVAEVHPDAGKVSYVGTQVLWAAAMAFHWSMLIVVFRHFRFFVEPVPSCIIMMQKLDGFFQIGVPVLYLSTIAFFAALVFLLLRRLLDNKVKYISLPSDYFALFLLIGIALTGAYMRHISKVDIVQIKEAIASWASFSAVAPTGVGVMYFVHVFLVSVLLIYFPFSKLLHAPGVFFSPTRNLANSNRAERHINPWNPDIVGHTYAEWEEEFKDKLVASGYELEGK